MAGSAPLLWQDIGWVRQAADWIRAEARRLSITLHGEIEQPHVYPWSTVLRVPSSEGILFFKATAPETVYEARLTQALAGWFPDCMPELLAVDGERGWMLMRDGGEQLRASIRPNRDATPWLPVIARYAEIQMDAVDLVPALLALGIPDWRLSRLPGQFSTLLADEAILRVDKPDGITADELRRLHVRLPRFSEICRDLASFGIPESINHGDLTDGNVLRRNGRITFFDWGDASITHPFVSLRTLFVSLENSLNLELEDWSLTPEMSALLQRYLERWQSRIPAEALAAAYPLSQCVASVAKALGWSQTVSPLQGALREEYAWIVPEVLKEFLIVENMLSA
jgi:hypothetical protein